MNTRQTILVALAAAVIFGAGVVTGGLLVHQTRPRPAPIGNIPFLGRVDALGRAANQLNLSPDQRRHVGEIVRNAREQIADCFMILEPDIQQVFRDMRRQLQAELTSDQRAEFEEILRKRQPRAADHRTNAAPPTTSPSPTPTEPATAGAPPR